MSPEAIADMVGPLIPADRGLILVVPTDSDPEAVRQVVELFRDRGYKSAAVVTHDDITEVAANFPDEVVIAGTPTLPADDGSAADPLYRTIAPPRFLLPVDRDALVHAIERAANVFPLADGVAPERFAAVVWEVLDVALPADE